MVPAGMIQLEMGMTHERTDGSGSSSIGEGLLRIPLSRRLEARIGFPSLFVDGSRKVSDASVGAKIELPDGPGGYQFGVIGSMSLPTGQAPLSAETVVPSVILAAGGPLVGSAGIGGQITASLPEQSDSRVLVSGATLVVSAPIGAKTGAFLELAGESVEFDDLHLLSHAGVTFAVDPMWQLDVHLGTALTDDSPDLFVGFGFVYRR
ncbi:MAG: transporter [Rhodothermales bacterium]|nr:transporter [Rhodothermales bacterium]